MDNSTNTSTLRTLTNNVTNILDSLNKQFLKYTGIQTSNTCMILGVFGLFPVISSISSFLRSIYRRITNAYQIDISRKYLTRSAFSNMSFSIRLGNDATYALVTSPCTSVGVKFCQSLSQKGYNILLVGRNKARMGDLAGHLMTKYKNNVIVIDINLSKEYTIDQIEEYLYATAVEYEISLLVLNPAFLLDGPFEDSSNAEISEIMRYNIEAFTNLLNVFTPKLRKRSLFKPTAIILVTSPLTKRIFIPNFTVYSAVGQYLVQLTKAYKKEYPTIDMLYYHQRLVDIVYKQEFDMDSSHDSDTFLRSINTNENEYEPQIISDFKEVWLNNFYWMKRDYFKQFVQKNYKKYDFELL